MRCILCYDSVVNILNAKIKERKGLITHYKIYVVIAFTKDVHANHSINVKKI